MSKINTLLNSLIFDPDFTSLYHRYVATSPLEVVELKEDNKANILAWLLNPAEGHLQGDYFLKMLISTAYQYAKDEQLERLPSGLILNTISFSKISVMREVVIKNNCQIDLLLADVATKTVIVIERKDGTLAAREQLRVYYDWVQEHYSNWHQLFILSDSQNRDHKEEEHEFYIQLNDSWLSHALLEIINKDGLPNRLEHSFRDIHDFVFGEWDEKNDLFFKDFDKQHKKIAHQYADILRLLKHEVVTIKGKSYKLCDVNPHVYFSQIKPNQAQYTLEEMELFSCLQSNYLTINSLCNYSEFDFFDDKVLQRWPDLESSIYKDIMYFILKKHVTNDSAWPYHMEFRRIKNNETNEATYNICFSAGRYGQENTWNIAEEFAHQCKFNINKNWKWREKIIESNIKELSLENPIINRAILSFIDKAKKLPNL